MTVFPSPRAASAILIHGLQNDIQHADDSKCIYNGSLRSHLPRLPVMASLHMIIGYERHRRFETRLAWRIIASCF